MAGRKTVTVREFTRDLSDTVPDYAVLPEGCPEEGAIVLFRPLESLTKYRRITLDCRTWTNRMRMYAHLREALGFSGHFGENLDALADELSASCYYVTLLWCCVPLTHMKQYFIRTMRVMKDMGALEAVYGEDVRDYPESFMEVDFAAGDTPHRPFRNPPREQFVMPPLDEMW